MKENFFKRFIEQPQKVWFRKAMFQIHLWVGLILALYLIVVCVTGSILVFRAELSVLLTSYPEVSRGEQKIDLPQAMEIFSNKYPDRRFVSAIAPHGGPIDFDFYLVYWQKGKDSGGTPIDPVTGEVYEQYDVTSHLLMFVYALHANLLLGRGGEIANGIGAILLIILSISGLIIWWQGIKRWTRALKINLRAGWKRINFDLHNSLGFWTLAITLMWAITSVYLVWQPEFKAFVSLFSTVTKTPEIRQKIEPRSGKEFADLKKILAEAQKFDPNAKLSAIGAPFNSSIATIVRVAPNGDVADHENLVNLLFDPYTGEFLKSFPTTPENTTGDHIIALMEPLHFGTSWGLFIKILWAILGFVIPLLTVTGILMYWNRYLSKKWKNLRRS